jgi:hypothetical protein
VVICDTNRNGAADAPAFRRRLQDANPSASVYRLDGSSIAGHDLEPLLR